MATAKKFILDKETLQHRGFYRLLLFAALVGLAVGAITGVFLEFLHWFEHFIWHEIPHLLHFSDEARWFLFLVPVIGGLLVGLSQKFLGNHPAEIAGALNDFRETGEFDDKHIVNGVVTSIMSLGFGGSLGPEAALVGLSGGLGTLAAKLIRSSASQARAITYFSISASLAAFFKAPLGGALLPIEGENEDLPSQWIVLPGIVAAIFGLVTFTWITPGGLFDYTFPAHETNILLDLLVTLPLAIVGGLLGWFFGFLHETLHTVMHPLQRHPVIRGITGGLALGILAMFLPFVLFSGQDGLHQVIDDGLQMGATLLILSALAKMVATNFLLATGWKGGHIFPLWAAAGALGLAISILIPGLNPTLSMAVIMTSMTAADLRKPLAVILLLILFFPIGLYPTIILAAIVGIMVIKLLKPLPPTDWEPTAPTA